MPRGGHNAKPIALHQLHGTYRKGRHAGGLELERRLRPVPDNFCGLCGTRKHPFAYGPTERATICPACAVGAVLAFRDGGDEVLIADLFESAELVLVERSTAAKTAETAPETGAK